MARHPGAGAAETFTEPLLRRIGTGCRGRLQFAGEAPARPVGAGKSPPAAGRRTAVGGLRPGAEDGGHSVRHADRPHPVVSTHAHRATGGHHGAADIPGRRFHRPALRRQSRRRLHPGNAPRRRVDATGRPRDERLRDGVPRAPGRRFRPALVHADGRGRPLRPRDARERARAVAGRSSRAGRAGPLPHPQRPAGGEAHGRPHRDRLRRLRAAAARSASGARGGARRRPESGGPVRYRLPARRRRQRGHGARARPGSRPSGDAAGPGGVRHQPGFDSRIRLRIPRLRAQRRHLRGSGHRFDPLLPGAVLAPAPGKGRVHRLPGVGPGRRAARAGRRRAGAPGGRAVTVLRGTLV